MTPEITTDKGVANQSADSKTEEEAGNQSADLELEEGMKFRDTEFGGVGSEFEIQESNASEWKAVYCDGYVANVDSRWINEGLENGKLKRVGGSE